MEGARVSKVKARGRDESVKVKERTVNKGTEGRDDVWVLRADAAAFFPGEHCGSEQRKASKAHGFWISAFKDLFVAVN